MTHSSSSSDKQAPLAPDRDIEEDRAMLGDLLGTYRGSISDWEKNFCESCLNRILKYKTSLSVKQADTLDKTWLKYTDGPRTDPTPKNNPPADFAKSEADDIPF